MKKIYSALALAMVVGVSANAARTESMINSEAKTITATQFATSMSEMEKSEGAQKKMMTRADNGVVGYYMGRYVDFFSDAEGLSNSTFRVTPSSEAGYVDIVGFCYDMPVKGKYDAANGTISVKKQLAFHSDYYNEDIFWLPLMYNQTTKTVVELEELIFDVTTLTFNNGELAFDGCLYTDWFNIFGIIHTWDSTGKMSGWSGMNNIHMIPFTEWNEFQGLPVTSAFEFNANEWVSKGNVSFQDGFLSPVMTNQVPAYEIEAMVNVNDPYKVLLVNPYGPNTPYDAANDATDKTGYIMMDIANPDIIKLYPFVYSGIGFTEFFFYGNSEFYMINQEGAWAYIDGQSDEDIETSADIYGYELSSMDDTGIVRIPNNMHSMQYSLDTPEFWVDDDTEEIIESETIITLNEDILGGVEGILDDASNVAATYYNLQGVRVANPVAGEVVIVKKGAKTTKTIVK